MDTFLELRPLWAIAITPLAAVGIFAAHKWPNVREAVTMLASVLLAGTVLSMIPDVLAGEVFELHLLTLASGWDLVLRTDPLGMIFASVASILWIATSVYSIGYMRNLDEPHQTGYFAAFAMCIFAAIGLAFSGNPLTFLVFYEVLTISTYPLVVHKRTPEAIAVGRKYLAFTLTAGLCLLLAVGWIQTIAPAASFTPGGFLDASMASRTTLTIIFVLMMLGVGVKAGIMPLHAWLPAAMIAPTPVSALLHAVAVVKAGVFGTIRVLMFVFGADTLKDLGVTNWLIVIASITILTASVIALSQDNLKRRLAYSTISQLSYIVLGAALLTSAGLMGSVMHIVNHAFMKITLFMCAGTVYAHLHVTEISDMKGIGKAMPLTMTAFAVGAVGLAGVPPTPGFMTKILLAGGAVSAEMAGLVFVLVGSALLNVLYFFPIIFNAFFVKNPKYAEYNEARWALVGPLAFTAAASLVLGLAPELGPDFWGFAKLVVASVFGNVGGAG